MTTAWECFHSATLELVRSSPIKNRLAGAYRRYLADVKEEQLPRELREDFSKVVRSMSCVRPQPGEDRVTASVRKMSNTEADECAVMIVEIFGNLSSAMGSAPQAPATRSSASVVVPLHPEIDIPATIASVNRA
jgi:hypothetical protein